MAGLEGLRPFGLFKPGGALRVGGAGAALPPVAGAPLPGAPKTEVATKAMNGRINLFIFINVFFLMAIRWTFFSAEL